MSYTVDKDTPPPFDGVEYWERTLDPYHPDAYKNVMSVMDRCYQFGIWDTLFNKRKGGWLGINRENPEAYVPDGITIDSDKPEFFIGRYLGKVRAFRNEEQMVKDIHKRYPKL